MSIQLRKETVLDDVPAVSPSARVILVVDSSDVTATAIPQFCSYLLPILDRLSHIHQTLDIKLGQVVFSTPPTSPDHSPIVSQTNFQTPSHVLSLIRDHPANMGIGQVMSGSGMPMAIVDGIIAALEMFDLETTVLQSTNTSSHNIIYHLILATSQPPEKIRQSSAASRNQFDLIKWQTLPSALRKRRINLSLFLTAPNPSLHHMYNQAAPDAGYIDKPWFPTDGNSVYLMGMTSSPKSDPRGFKRRHDVDSVEDSYSRSGTHGADPTRTMKRARQSDTSGIVSNPDMQNHHPNNIPRSLEPVDPNLSNASGSNSLGGPHSNSFVGGQSLDPFDPSNSDSVNMFDQALSQSMASWDASSYQDPFFTGDGGLNFPSNYLSDTTPDFEGQRFDLQYSASSDPSTGLFHTGFDQSGFGSSSTLSDMLDQNSGSHSNRNLGENLHALRDGGSGNHPNAFYDQPPNTLPQHRASAEQSQRVGNGNGRLPNPSHVPYPAAGDGSSPPDPSLGSRVQLQQGSSSQTGIQASSTSTQFNEPTNYYQFSPYPSQSLTSDTFSPNSVPLPSSAESHPYQNMVSGIPARHIPVNGADSSNAQSGLRISQKRDDGKSMYALSPKEALALGPISHPQIPRTSDNTDTFRDRLNNPPANDSGASTSLSLNLPSEQPLPDTPQTSSGDDTGASSADDGDESFDAVKSMNALGTILSGAERHYRKKRMKKMTAPRGKPNEAIPTQPVDTSTPGAGPSRTTHAPPPPSNLRMLATTYIPKPSHQRAAPPAVGREWTGVIHVDGQSFNGIIRPIDIPVSIGPLQGPSLLSENWPEHLFFHVGTVSGPMDWTAFQNLLDTNNITPIPVRLNSQTTGAGATQIEPETQGYWDLISLLQNRNTISRILFEVSGGPQGAGFALYAAPEAGTSSFGLRVAYFDRIPVPTAEQLSPRPQLIVTPTSASSLTGPTLYPTPAEIQRVSGMTSGPQDFFLPPSPPNENSQQGLSHLPYQYPPTSASPPMRVRRNSAAHASSPNEFLSTNVATYPNSLRGPPPGAGSPSSPSDNARFPTSNRVHSAQFGGQPAPQALSYEQVSHGHMRAISSTSNDGMGLLGYGIPPRGSQGDPSPSVNHQSPYGHAMPLRDPMQNPTYPLDVDPMSGAVLGASSSFHRTAPYQRVADPRQFSPGQAHA